MKKTWVKAAGAASKKLSNRRQNRRLQTLKTIWKHNIPMRLTSVAIQGFKSFARPTHLTFGPGVTGVIGPNGSGKSNVAEAIRWVLGEQSMKALRGKERSDVIYSGDA